MDQENKLKSGVVLVFAPVRTTKKNIGENNIA